MPEAPPFPAALLENGDEGSVSETDLLLQHYPPSERPPPTAELPPRNLIDYNAENHFQVLLQMHGSVWGSVLPFCLATFLETVAVILLRQRNIVDLTIKDTTGHSFMSLLVSFLLVTRATITYNRFMEARQHLSDLYRHCREVVQYACLLSSTNINPLAVQWRQDVAYTTMICLRMASAAVEFRSHGVSAWDVLPERDHDQMELFVSQHSSNIIDNDEDELALGDHHSNNGSSPTSVAQERVNLLQFMAHGPRTQADENLRAPIVWAYNLRKQILKTRSDRDILQHRPFHVNEELKLFSHVSGFLSAFHGHRKLITTPFPFPLQQMARTFLFFWVFSLPLVLVPLSDDAPDSIFYSLHNTIEVVIIIFFCTYGFVGLEYVCIEMDDPYGHDPNDFPCQRWAELVFEDIYLMIYKTDGIGSARTLKRRMTDRMRRGAALDLFHRSCLMGMDSATFDDDEQSQLGLDYS